MWLILFKIVLGFLAFVSLYLLAAWILAVIPVNSKFKNAPEGIPVYIMSNGVHIDLCLPFKSEKNDWSSFIDTTAYEPPKEQFTHITFGWGDKGFFLDTPTWAELKFKTAFRAIFWLSESAMHVSLLEEAPSESDLVKCVYLNDRQYRALVDYVVSSFALLHGHVDRVDRESYYPHMNDSFYESVGRYNLFKTCNNWANLGLKKAGVKTAVWAPFDKSILHHHE